MLSDSLFLPSFMLDIFVHAYPFLSLWSLGNPLYFFLQGPDQIISFTVKLTLALLVLSLRSVQQFLLLPHSTLYITVFYPFLDKGPFKSKITCYFVTKIYWIEFAKIVFFAGIVRSIKNEKLCRIGCHTLSIF